MINKILYTDLSTVTYTDDNTGNSGFTVQSLNNYVPSYRWVGDAGVVNTIQIQFNTPRSCNAICIATHNLKYFGMVMLSTTGYSLDLSTDNEDPIYIEFANTVTAQTWTITIPAVTDLSPFIGNIFLDKLITFDIPPQAGFKIGNTESVNTYRQNLSGTIMNAGTNDTKFKAELNFPFITETMKMDFIQFIKVCGKTIPFYFIDSDRNVKYMLVDANYTPISILRYRWNQLLNFIMRSFDLSNAYISVPIEMIPGQYYVTHVE